MLVVVRQVLSESAAGLQAHPRQPWLGPECGRRDERGGTRPGNERAALVEFHSDTQTVHTGWTSFACWPGSVRQEGTLLCLLQQSRTARLWGEADINQSGSVTLTALVIDVHLACRSIEHKHGISGNFSDLNVAIYHFYFVISIYEFFVEIHL